VKRALLYQVGEADGVAFETLAAEVRLAEELGVETVWCFPTSGDEGRLDGSAPEVWLAGLAARTSTIRLGWGRAGLLPPSRPPLRVAEQAATLDVSSEGRIELALVPDGEIDSGEGASANDWQEGYRMLVDMWDAPRFSWQSERFDVKPLDVVPKPVQSPHPALWLAGWSSDHARAAGRGGLGYLDLSGAPADALQITRDAYAEGRAEVAAEDLVSVDVFAVAADLEPGEEAQACLQAWESMGVDQATLRLGAGVGTGAAGHAAAQARIRFFTDATEALH